MLATPSHLCYCLLSVLGNGGGEALVNVLQQGSQLLPLGLRHVLQQQLVPGTLVLADALHLGLNANLL